MSFANTDSAPDKERIVGKAGIVDDTLGGGVGIVIGIADNKIVEGVLRMKVGGERRLRGSIRKKRRTRVFIGGRRRDRLLENEFDFDAGFGLIVEGIFEKVVVAFVVDVNQI